MRFIHLIVVAALVAAAVDVYRIKFEAAAQAERVGKLRSAIRREHDAIAALRARWAQLDNPARIQALAQRHLSLRPIEDPEVVAPASLPERPPAADTPARPSRGTAVVVLEAVEDEAPTGSIGALETLGAASADEPAP
jgi:hypothetical protein